MTRSILLVEDDRVVATSLKAQLEARQVAVLLAHSMEEARRQLTDGAIDFVLIDYHLPDGPGTELGQEILQTKGIPFALLTADGSEAVIDAAVAAGAVGFVLKPALAEAILPAIETAMARAAELKKMADAVTRLAASSTEKRTAHLACGMLMERFRLTESDAGRLLRYFARSHRITLENAANQVLDGAASLDLLTAAIRFVDKRAKPGAHKDSRGDG